MRVRRGALATRLPKRSFARKGRDEGDEATRVEADDIETNSAVGKLALHRDLKKKNVKSTQHWTIDARSGDVLGYFGQLFRDYLFLVVVGGGVGAPRVRGKKKKKKD